MNEENKYFLALADRVLPIVPLPKEVAEKAKRELNETDENRMPSIIKLREMLQNDNHCKLPLRTDDEFLLRFLRARKFDLKRAKKMVICYQYVYLHVPFLNMYEIHNSKYCN